MDDKKNLHILSAIAFMDLFAVGLTVPLFSNHIRELGGTHFIAGLLGTVYSGIQLFSGPIVGSWSDLRGRKPVLIVTLLVSSICYFTIGITSSLYIIFVSRVILGFTKHTQTLCKAFIADTIPKEKQSTVYGYTTSVSMIGFVVGPILGGHLSELKNGYFYVCSITSALFFINILLTNILPTPKREKENKRKIHKEVIKVIIDLTNVNWKSYWSLFSTKFFHALAITVYYYNFSIILREYYGASQKTIGYLIALQSCIGTISGFLTGWINKTFYKTDVMHSKKYFYSFITMTISFVLLCMATEMYTFLIGLIPLAISNSFLRIIETEILLAKSENDKGSLAGTSNSLTSLARLAAPMCSGILGDFWGQNAVMYSTVVLSLCGTMLAGVINVKMKQKSN